MIGTYMSGRLGNQFFRYAYTRAIQHARGDRDHLIFNFNMVYNKDPKDKSFENVLKYFKVQPYQTTTKDLVWTYGSLRQKWAYIQYQINVKGLGRLFGNVNKRKVHSYLNLRKKGIMYAKEDENAVTFPCPATNDVFINGNFENSKYFNSIRDILVQEFKPKAELLPQNTELFSIITKTNSVCVTIRRGDYLSNRYKNAFFLCDEHYFDKAIQIIREKVKNPTFVFFSDDIEWVKNNMRLKEPCYYESGNDPIWEKIRLMSACKHFIISNSTFSWWAQYLGVYPEKIVVSPNRWYNAEWTSMLIEDSFIKIPV